MISLSELSPYELGLTYDKAAIPILIEYLNKGKPNERRLAASAIGKLSNEFPKECNQAISALLHCLRLKNQPQTIQYCLKALDKLDLSNEDFDKIKYVLDNDIHAYNKTLAKSVLSKKFNKKISQEPRNYLPISHDESINSFEDYSIRNKFPAHYRTIDGHFVRSRAEVIIDNWLFVHGIAHAYEKQVPVTEDIFCDFYLLQNKIYIEYWGLTDKKDYVKRKEDKKRIYEKYKLNLVELSEKHLHDLDAYLPKLLLKFNVKMI
jgi:hypothetical protein